MRKETAEALVEALYDFVSEDSKIYEGYSGRGMYGKETYGVVVGDINDVQKAAIELAFAAGQADDEGELMADLRQGFRSDSLGLSIIIY